MIDLETRRILAEFADKPCLRADDPQNPPDELWMLEGGCAPHYESDPAAACSLLPKLGMRFAQRGMYQKWLHLKATMFDLLYQEQEDESTENRIYARVLFCELIADALRKVKDA